MSLQIWLPLKGSLENQGLNNTSVSLQNGTPTYENNGKIGKCLYNSSTGSNITIPYNFYNTEQLSITFWVKPNSPKDWMDLFSIGEYANRMETNNSNGDMYYWFNDNGSRALAANQTSIFPMTNNIWHHIACTIDGNNVKIYQNGILKLTTPQLHSLSSVIGNYPYIYIGRRRFSEQSYYNGYFNDVRIYNHALSQKEVQELAKGLVLHYRLAGPGQENIIEHSHNGSGWSIGSGWTAFTDGDGTKGYRFTRTGATSNNWVRVIPPTKINPNDYPEGITVSMDIKTPDISAINHTCVGALQIYDSTGTRSGWCEPHWDLSKVKNNVWTKVSYFFTQAQLKTISQSGMTCSYTMFSFQLVQNGDISIKNFKAERGNVRTPWTPNKADAAWTTMGYSNNTEYDCSGYGNNGTIKYPPTWDVNSPRYTTSYKFDGTAYLTIPNPFPTETVVREFSHTAWIKWDSTCNTNNGIHSIAYSNNFFRFALGKANQMWAYGVRCAADGSGETQTGILQHGTSSSLVNGKWYFIAITFKDGVCKAYLDGEQVASTTSTLVGLKSKTSNGAIGAYMPEGNEPAIGNISDSRFYVTELSAEDIQELYHSAVIIDNTGKTYAYEYFEAT